MRWIGTIVGDAKQRQFSDFLQSRDITHQIESSVDKDWGSDDYQSIVYTFWIENEEKVQESTDWLNRFKESPEDPFFQQKTELPPFEEIEASPTGWDKQPMGWLTKTLLTTCCLLLAFSQFWNTLHPIPREYSILSTYSSPVNQHLLYDYPLFYQLLNKFVASYGYESLGDLQNLSPQEAVLYKKINAAPIWNGVYPYMVKGETNKIPEEISKGGLFEKISQGEIWRLITPCLLHGDLLHLFFNMLWLAVLGKQIEQRLGAQRSLLLMVIIGIVSNTSQYLMSGPAFLGFSGVLCGMLGFIWVRQKKTPWEGYRIDPSTFFFMLIFVFGMASLEIIAFFAEKFYGYSLPLHLANTAHITGGITGWLLGQSTIFSWKEA